MRKILILGMALLLVISLFSGCGQPAGNGDAQASAEPAATAKPAEATPSPTAAATEAPPAGGISNLAPGKVKVDADGAPDAPYEYTLPLSDSDAVFSCWTTVWFPQFLGDPDYNKNEFIVEQENRTGVHIHYDIVSSVDMATNFAVLLASEDLRDIMTHPDTYYPGTALSAIEDNYFINIYDYKEYCPNYMYVANKMAPDDMRLHDSIYLDKTHILKFWSVMDQPLPATTYMVREDWLDKLGMKVDDIRTVDDFMDMLEAFKSQIDTAIYPLVAFGSVLDTNHYFACYDFYTMVGEFPGAAVKEGKAEFQFRNDDAKAYVEMYREFFARGFVDPNWGTGDSWDFKENVYANKTGVLSIAVDEISSYLPMIQDPNASIHPLHKPVLYEGQVLHLGNDASQRFYGGCGISAGCEDIPLVVSWCDWRYSPSGSDFATWGIQGLTWDYNDSGERELTDFVLQNPYGCPTSWCMTMWAMNRFSDHGLAGVEVQYAFDDARPYFPLVSWQVHEYTYDGAYEWPLAASLDAEQSREFLSLCTDLNTYISEQIPIFATGDAPMSEWDNYLETMYALNLAEGEAIYTEAYQNYLAKQ